MELQAEDGQARTIRAEKLGRIWEDSEKLGRNWEDSDGILSYQSILYIPEIIRTGLIRSNYDASLAGHFGIEKKREYVTNKYYWETLFYNVEAYIRGCDICLASKVVKH